MPDSSPATRATRPPSPLVLVVDDEAIVLEALRAALGEEGYEVETFDEALQAVRGRCRVAALTRSEKGCVILDGDEVHVVDAEPAERVVDTTGAGDLFAGGFLYGHTQGRGAYECGRIGAIAAANGLQALPSATNFVAVDCGRDGAFAKRILDELVARGVFVRMPFVEPQNRCIRISAGTDEDLDLLETVLPKAIAAAGD